MALIAINGKKGSGKDTVGLIIQYLTFKNSYTRPNYIRRNNEIIDLSSLSYIEFNEIKNTITYNNIFQIKKFADPLKDMLCILLNCTREDLENEEFKSKELPEEWWYYKIPGLDRLLPRGYYPNKADNDMCDQRYLVKPTPRLLMQLLGTEAGRNILHPNLWSISLFSGYQLMVNTGDIDPEGIQASIEKYQFYPNWVITDVRFPNEAQSIKDRKGILIRIESDRCNLNDTHPSETSLDKYGWFEYTIYNNGTISDLIDEIRTILKKEEYI